LLYLLLVFFIFFFFFFFFQAEDGIRDLIVTGVQTCALPIYIGWLRTSRSRRSGELSWCKAETLVLPNKISKSPVPRGYWPIGARSEERRVGKECRGGGGGYGCIERGGRRCDVSGVQYGMGGG